MSSKIIDLPSPHSSALRWQWVLVVLGVCLATGLILGWGLWRSPAGAYDDAYITYRYADNLRSGLGLRYNPGEWVLGTTTPLFTLLLGGVGFFFANLEGLGHWSGVFFWIGAAWLAAALLWQDHRPVAAAVAPLLMAVQGPLLRSVGMETPLLLFLMLAVAWAWLGGRQKLTVIMAAGLLLVRHDSFLWLLLLGLEIWRRERRLPWREGVFTILLTLPWFLFAFWRYGSPLPNSAAAKVGQTNLMAVPELPSFAAGLFQEATLSWSPLIVPVLLIALLPVAVHWVTRPERPYWWVAAWLAAYTLFYTAIGVVIFPWYFVPALSMLALLAAVGAGIWLGDRGWWGASRPVVGWLWRGIGVVLILLLLIGHGAETVNAAQISHGYQPAYLPAGAWLADHAGPEDDVATIEIGVVGYHSRRPILDTMGLVTVDMTDHQFGWRETLVYALSAHRPAFVVTLPNTAWDEVLQAWWFNRDYFPAATFDNVTLYERHPLPASAYAVPAAAELAQGLSVTGVLFSIQDLVPGQTLEADVHLLVEVDQETDYFLTVYLVDTQTNERYAVTTEALLSGWYPGWLWQAGDRLALPVRVDLPPDLPEGTYRLGIMLFDLTQEQGLPWRGDPAGPPADLQLGWLRQGAPPSMTITPPATAENVAATWQNGIVLETAALPANPLPAGGELPVQLTWRATRPVSRDLTRFVHLVDVGGAIVAQADARPFDGRWPTPAWQAGEVIQEVVTFPLPEGLTDGEYWLRLGWYDAAGRVPLTGGNDYLFLAETIEVSNR